MPQSESEREKRRAEGEGVHRTRGPGRWSEIRRRRRAAPAIRTRYCAGREGEDGGGRAVGLWPMDGK
jgi:hypothetical protein